MIAAGQTDLLDLLDGRSEGLEAPPPPLGETSRRLRAAARSIVADARALGVDPKRVLIGLDAALDRARMFDRDARPKMQAHAPRVVRAWEARARDRLRCERLALEDARERGVIR